MPPELRTCPFCNDPGARLVYADKYIKSFRCPRCRRKHKIDTGYIEESKAGYICFNHQGKGTALIDALNSRGYIQMGRPARSIVPRFALSDSDVAGRLSQMRRMSGNYGVRAFFIYPHSARPSLIHDHYPTWGGVTAQFVVNEYHAEVLRVSGYTKPIEPIGWHLCPIREFKARETCRRVLFAPIHPRNAPQDKNANLRAFDVLHKLVRRDEIDLTIRHIGQLVDSGLEAAQGVHYQQINGMNGDHSFFDEYDLIIGHQTIAWMGVAMGVPVVMFAEDMPTHFRNRGIGWMDAKSWPLIHELIRYPLDLLTAPDPMALLDQTVKGDSQIADWRRRMIGESFSVGRFVGLIESYFD